MHRLAAQRLWPAGHGDGAPSRYHLLFYAWGRAQPFSAKAKRERLSLLAQSIEGCRVSGPRAQIYHGVGSDSEPEPEPEPEPGPGPEPEALALLSLLQLHDPSRRDEGGMSGRLQRCLLASECTAPRLLRELRRYHVAQRPLQGLTPIKPELAFVMSNLARLRRSGTVLDPFCGSGSLLIPAAHIGALAFGADVNRSHLVQQGQDEPEGRQEPSRSVAANFRRLGLPPPEILCDDIFKPSWGAGAEFDAIVADPPYGTREQRHAPAGAGAAGGGVGAEGERSMCYIGDSSGEELLAAVAAMVAPLLALAQRCLAPAGRLVYLLRAISMSTFPHSF